MASLLQNISNKFFVVNDCLLRGKKTNVEYPDICLFVLRPVPIDLYSHVQQNSQGSVKIVIHLCYVNCK